MQSNEGPAAQLPMPTGVTPGKVGGLQVPKGRQNTAGGETPGKVGGLQALKGRRNTSRGFTPGYTLPPLRGLLPPCFTGGFTPGCTLTSLRDCFNHSTAFFIFPHPRWHW